MKGLANRRHPRKVGRYSTRRMAPAQVVVLTMLVGGAGCVLNERFTGLDDDSGGSGSGSSGIADAQPVETTEDGLTATSGGESTGNHREVDSTTGESTGSDDSLPEGSTGSATTTGFGPFNTEGDCCSAHQDAGCDDPEVAECVCAGDPFCCEEEWDELCVDMMNHLGCMSCPSNKLPPPPGLCCEPTYGRGCVETEISECVCAIDPFCCQVEWDDTCVALVESQSCGQCPGTACCSTTPEPGCPEDIGIEACVCAEDPFCCDTEWDGVCVSGVHSYGCGACVFVSQGGDCCTDNGSPGCDDPMLEACVCAGDPFCCQTSWDALCAEQVGTFGCGDCPLVTTGTGGSSGGYDEMTGSSGSSSGG